VRALWRRLPWLCNRFPDRQAAAVAAILAGLAYAALAGFALPTQRAAVMLTAGLGAILLRRSLQPLHALALALLGVLLFDPAAVRAAGLWLSFAAVAAILAATQGRQRAGRLAGVRGLVRIQLAIALVLAPLLLYLQQVPAPWAPLVNLFAVPWFSLFLVPLLLAGGLLLTVGMGGLLGLAAAPLSWTLTGLAWAAGLPGPQPWLPVPSLATALLGVAGALWLLGPPALPGRYLGLLLLAPLGMGSPRGPCASPCWTWARGSRRWWRPARTPWSSIPDPASARASRPVRGWCFPISASGEGGGWTCWC